MFWTKMFELTLGFPSKNQENPIFRDVMYTAGEANMNKPIGLIGGLIHI
jgi:hypothetical protein